MSDSSFEQRDDRQRVLDATDIVNLIGEFVNLQPKGREFVGLCPFHDDRNPSFFVNPAKDLFKCFACGEGGIGGISFAMKYHRMTYPEALKYLAERANIELTPFRPNRRPPSGSSPDSSGAPGDHAPMVSGAVLISAHETARDFFRALLRHESHGDVGRRSFAERGISEEMIERFELGVAPNRYDGLVTVAMSKNLDLRPYAAAGLLLARKDGNGFVDRFRHRLIFPIHDIMGRPIAFGGRRIEPDDEPKYLNSPEHPKFNKSETLYGLHLARRSIQSKSLAIVVEGYTDVIACHQAGVENVVATLGTAMTRAHGRVLERLCDRVVLLFDGDEAGQKAADRAIEVFFKSNVDVRIAILPPGTDPADMLADGSVGVERFENVVDSGTDALDFMFELLKTRVEDGGVSSRQKHVSALLERLGRLGFHDMNPLRRDLVVARLGDLTNLSAAAVLAAIPRPRPPRKPMAPASGTMEPKTSPNRESSPILDGEGGTPVDSAISEDRRDAESWLVGSILLMPHMLEEAGPSGEPWGNVFDVSWILQPAHRQILDRLMRMEPDTRSATLVVTNEDDVNDQLLITTMADLQWRVSRATAEEEHRIRAMFAASVRSLSRMVHDETYREVAVEHNASDRLDMLRQRPERGLPMGGPFSRRITSRPTVETQNQSRTNNTDQANSRENPENDGFPPKGVS